MSTNREMKPVDPSGPAETPPSVAAPTVLWLLVATLGGVAAALHLLPHLAPGMSASLAGESPKGYWYLARASAWVAFILLWVSMAMGLVITNKLARIWPGGPTALEVHEHVSLLALAFVLFHAMILLGDRYIGYSLAAVFVPFASRAYRPVSVALGQIGFYGMAVVALAYYLRRRPGGRRWRLVHYLSFAVFLLALAHGLASGTDSGAGWAQAIYWMGGASVALMTTYRVTRIVRPELARQRA